MKTRSEEETKKELISFKVSKNQKKMIKEMAEKVMNYLEKIQKPVHVAVMGCVVNGPGEAKNADIGIAGGLNEFVIFKKEEILGRYSEDKVFDVLVQEINKL